MNILQIAAQITTGLAVTFLILQWGRNSGRKGAESEMLASHSGPNEINSIEDVPGFQESESREEK